MQLGHGCETPIGCRSAPRSLRGRSLERWGLEGVGPSSDLATAPTPPRDLFLEVPLLACSPHPPPLDKKGKNFIAVAALRRVSPSPLPGGRARVLSGSRAARRSWPGTLLPMARVLRPGWPFLRTATRSRHAAGSPLLVHTPPYPLPFTLRVLPSSPPHP